MANSLNREIKQGERVVVSASLFKSPNVPVEERTFICETGFGMKPYLSGKKIIGKWADGAGHDSIPGDWIDVNETNELQAREAGDIDALK